MRVREVVAVGFGTLACATAVLAVGGAFRWTQAIVAFLLTGALASHLLSRRRLGRMSPLVAGLLVALALTALSLIPLPAAVIEALDPTGAALREEGAALLDISPWSALTRDVPGSLRSLVFFAILLGVATVTLRSTASERGRYHVLAVVAVLCGVVALVTGLHVLVGATKLYGVYVLKEARPSVLGPLLNENHLGGLMALGTCVSLGLAMHHRQPTWARATWFAILTLCGVMTAASGSRGAIIALVVGGVIACGVVLGQRIKPRSGSRASFATSALPIGVVALCAVVVAVYSSAGKVTDELGKTTSQELHQPRSKFVAWHSAKELIAESPWVGVGRGGFESSFTRVHPPSGSVIFSYVENEYIQVVLDWGVVGAACLGAVMLWFGAVAIRRWRDGALTAGALGALGAVAVQSTVDFGVELLGLAIPVVAVASVVAYVPLRQVSSHGVKAPLLRALQILALIGGGMLLLSSATTTLAEDHAAIARRGSATLDDVRAAVQRHPLDYFGYAIAADLTRNQPDSVRFLNHSLRLHPTHPDLHRMAAEALQRSGRDEQATIEYAAALRASVDPRPLLNIVVTRLSPELAARAIPLDYADIGLVLNTLRDLGHHDVAALWLPRVVEQRPRDIMLCNTLYEFALAHGELRTAEVAGRHCVELLPDYGTRMSLAKLLSSKGSHHEVITLLGDVATWRGHVDEKGRAWLMLCDAYITLRDREQARQCFRRLELAGIVDSEHRRGVADRLETLERAPAPTPGKPL